jgi:hypothetical protein
LPTYVSQNNISRMAVLVIAAYWLFLLALAIGAIRLLWSRTTTKRVIGAVLIVGFCALATTTIFRPEIRDWRLKQGTTVISAPRAVVFRSASPQIESLAAFFVTTGLFDAFVATPGSGWVDSADPIIVEKTRECQARADLKLHIPAKCIHRGHAIPLPPCRVQIDLNGTPPSPNELAQDALISVRMDGDQACPFFGAREWIRLPSPLSRIHPPFIMGDPPQPSAMRTHAVLTSPTVESILRAIGIEADCRSAVTDCVFRVSSGPEQTR